MRLSDRKEYFVVVLIFLVVVIGFAIYSSDRPQVVKIEPEKPTVLLLEDMDAFHGHDKVSVGITTRSEAEGMFPSGTNLGMSGLFRPVGDDCLFGFSKHGDILIRVDIEAPSFTTARGITAGDSFDKVVEKYGMDFAKAYEIKSPQNFDAYFGTDNYVLFKIEDNQVKKIYIGSPASYKT